MLVDSHCHLDDEQFESDLDAVVERALAAGVGAMLSIGTGEGLPDLEAGIRMAERYPSVRATAGIHPQFASQAQPEHFDALRELLSHPSVAGLGEIGLDYYWKPYDADQQARVFTWQMELARDAGKPITIHTREAWSDTFRLLREHWTDSKLPCVLHCFTGGAEEVRQGVELDCYFSFAGVVTYPKAPNVHEAARLVPANRLLIETDSPYLPPVPYRGKRNEPAYLVHTARRVAELRGVSYEQIAGLTTENFHRVWGSGA